MRQLADYLEDMIRAFDKIARYVADHDEASFTADEKTQDAVIRNIEIMGEAAKNICQHFSEFASAHPNLRLSEIYGMRNVLSHSYHRVSLSTTWVATQRDLPPLRPLLQASLDALGKED